MILELKQGVNRINENKQHGFSVVIAGDCCPWENGTDKLQDGKGNDILEAVKPFIDSADLRFIQFETPLADGNSPIDKSGPNLRCPEICRELLRGNFDVALLANNHIGDHGSGACLNTIRALKETGLKTVGAGENLKAAAEPLYLETHGARIAVLNFAEHEFGSATAQDAGCAVLDPLSNIAAIEAAKKDADLVFVIVHGGHERNPFPSPRMIRTYRAFAEAGAAMVINIHTHCPGGIEIWQGCPIVYCPGNFYFPWRDLGSDHLLPTWWLGYLPKFYCSAKEVYAIEIKPYRFDNDRIYELTGAETDEFFRYLNRISAPLAEPGAPERLFKIWTAAGNGHQYLGILKEYLSFYPGDSNDRGFVRKMLPPRNIFSCESHRDMMETYLRLIEKYEVEQYGNLRDEISVLQNPSFMTAHREKMRCPNV